MRYRAIPRKHLIHACKFYKRLSTDEYGKETFDDVVNVQYVLFQNIKENALKNLGEMKNDKCMMFYDYNSSYPKALSFTEQDRINYDGQDYIIRKIIDFKDHHCEILLT